MTHSRMTTRTFALLSVAVFSTIGFSQEWRDLQTMLPQSSNAVMAIDASSMFASELATNDHWQESHAKAFASNPMLLPPGATRFVLAAEMDLEYFEPTSEFAVMSLDRPVTMKEIQDRVGGEIDHIGGRVAFRTNQDAYIIPYDVDRIALARRAPRHWISRQVDLAERRKAVQIPDLLSKTIDRVASGEAQIAVAIHLADVLPESEISAAIERSKSLENRGVDDSVFAREMWSLDGIVLTVKITDQMEGTLEMVFRDPPKSLGPVSKPFLIEVLSGAGAVIPEFDQWQPDTKGSDRLAIGGTLTTEGLRKILSLLNVETVGVSPEQVSVESNASPVSEQLRAELATKRYASRISKMITGIAAGEGSNPLLRQVFWTDRSARAITRMQTRNVDDKVAALGRLVAKGLFEIVSTFQAASEEARYRSAAETPPPLDWHTDMVPYDTFVTPYGRFYRYRPFSFAQINLRANMVRSHAITAEEMKRAIEKAERIFAEIEDYVHEMNYIANRPRQ